MNSVRGTESASRAASSLKPNTGAEKARRIDNVRDIVRSYRDAFAKLYIESRPHAISESELEALRVQGLNGMKCILQSLGRLTNTDLLDHLRKVEEDAKKSIETKLLAATPHVLQSDSLLQPMPGATHSSDDLHHLPSAPGISNPSHTGEADGTQYRSSPAFSSGFAYDTTRRASNFNYGVRGSGMSVAPHPPLDSSFARGSPLNVQPDPASGFGDLLLRGMTSNVASTNSFQWNPALMNATGQSSSLGTVMSIRGLPVGSGRLVHTGNAPDSFSADLTPAITQEFSQHVQDKNGMYACTSHHYDNQPQGPRPTQRRENRSYDFSYVHETHAPVPEPRAFATTDPFETMISSSANRSYHAPSSGAPSVPPQVSLGQDFSRDIWCAHQPHPFFASPHFSHGPSFVPSGLMESPMSTNAAFNAGYASSEFAGIHSVESRSHGAQVQRHRTGETSYAPFDSQPAAGPSDFAFGPAPRRPDPPEVLEGLGLTAAQLQLLLQHGRGSSPGRPAS
jgi:hypothetical protein